MKDRYFDIPIPTRKEILEDEKKLQVALEHTNRRGRLDLVWNQFSPSFAAIRIRNPKGESLFLTDVISTARISIQRAIFESQEPMNQHNPPTIYLNRPEVTLDDTIPQLLALLHDYRPELDGIPIYFYRNAGEGFGRELKRVEARYEVVSFRLASHIREPNSSYPKAYILISLPHPQSHP